MSFALFCIAVYRFCQARGSVTVRRSKFRMGLEDEGYFKMGDMVYHLAIDSVLL